MARLPLATTLLAIVVVNNLLAALVNRRVGLQQTHRHLIGAYSSRRLFPSRKNTSNPSSWERTIVDAPWMASTCLDMIKTNRLLLMKVTRWLAASSSTRDECRIRKRGGRRIVCLR